MPQFRSNGTWSRLSPPIADSHGGLRAHDTASNKGRIMVFDVNPDSKKLFATLPTGGQTDRYECTLSICGNPTCRCRSVYVACVVRPPKGVRGDGRRSERKASIDLDTNGMYSEFRKTASKKDIAFCERLIAEMDAPDFRLLGDLHFEFKNMVTEEAEPDTIDIHFDFAEIESSAKMQVYNDILPFGDRFLVAIDGVAHMLLDQHCVRPGCACTETCIEVAPIMPDGKLGEHAGTILLDYASPRWQTVPVDAPYDLPALRQQIENAFPDFYPRLARRHAKLQAIYGHCRKRYLAANKKRR
jgi:hypothetical protein